MPHADDASGGSSRCPREHYEPCIKKPDGQESRFAVVKSIVGPREVRPCKHFLRPAHIQATLGQRAQPFGRIAGNPHI